MLRLPRAPRLLLCLLALWIATTARADTLREGENILTLSPQAEPFVSVTLWVGPPSAQACDDWVWGVPPGTCPAQAVRALLVTRAGSEILTRLSAWQDLGNPRSAHVRWQGRGRPFELVLHGGEGDTAWEAVLGFSGTGSGEYPDITLPTGLNGRLVSRRVRFVRAPERGWEETRYGPPR